MENILGTTATPRITGQHTENRTLPETTGFPMSTKIGQSKKHSIMEAIINVLVGYGIAVLTNLLILPIFGMHPSVADASFIGLIFTGVSLVRSYVLRRLFNSWHLKGN